MKNLARQLDRLVHSTPYWVEMRYHRRRTQSLAIQKGLVKSVRSASTSGVGIRVLVNGAWGFAATSESDNASLERALKQAVSCASAISALKKASLNSLPLTPLARGEFELPGYTELEKMSLGEKLQAAVSAEAKTRNSSSMISSAQCGYSEMFEDKIVATSDGALASSRLARSEIRLSAIAVQGGEMAESHFNVGRTGPWTCLFSENSLNELSENSAQLAVDLLKAPKIPGGKSTLILSPAIVGLLSHEAIGHTVEADFVLSGSVASGKLGSRVATDLVTLVDSGTVSHSNNAGGALLVDDEGVPTQRTVIIANGRLESYLHNRESAALFKVPPTGNARAWLYRDEPLIRMRNTYIEPGNQSLEEIIESTEDGYLVDGPLGGQADATGEFMFGAQKVVRIVKGKKREMYRGATISGTAFEVLSTVDAVSREFKLDLGSGYCGKGQPAKVDAGGPYVRCKATIGGMQR